MNKKFLSLLIAGIFFAVTFTSATALNMEKIRNIVIDENENLELEKSLSNTLWGGTEVISPDTVKSCDHNGIAITSDDTIYAVWSKYPEIMYAKRDPSGVWNDPEYIPDVKNDSTNICDSISVGVDDAGTLHLVYDIYGEGFYYKNKAVGEPWSEKEFFLENIPGDNSCPIDQSMAVSPDGTVHVVLVEGFVYQDWDLKYMQRKPNGEWSDKKIIDEDGVHDTITIDVDLEKNVHIAWSRSVRYGSIYHHEIFYIKRSANGQWSNIENAVQINGNIPDYAVDPCLKVDHNGNVHLVFETESYNDINEARNIAYSKRDDLGWQDMEYITKSSGNAAYSPYLSLDKYGGAHVVWRDCYGALDSGIVYRSRDSSGTLSDIELVTNYVDSLDDYTERYGNTDPHCVIDSQNIIHVIWEDGTDYLDGIEDTGGSWNHNDIFYCSRDLDINTNNYNAPTTPLIIGPSQGKEEVEYTFFFTSNDPDGDPLYYLIDWGDGQTGKKDDFIKEWIGPYQEGEKISIEHSWIIHDRDPYIVKCKTRDIYGFESDWCEPENIHISNCKSKSNSHLFLDLLSDNPNFYNFIKQIFNLKIK